ncbi:Etoposide induced 2.4 mRNA [Perkinsus chesapeaki]|uniref:Etoposide induced 2.4 mRNA n=1 Tax=Perkinsus chesapeaki TaxID=330153 RepID=A0A7J6MD25_PERCH|nr:Etoposide induced 2.4 mRNA [Perkinsus chesapeaki]
MEHGLLAAGREVWDLAILGIKDAVRLDLCLIFVLKSPTIRVRWLQCLVLNGVIFLGSVVIFRVIMIPLITTTLSLISGLEGESLQKLTNAFDFLHLFTWIIPVYSLSFILNIAWHQDIANESFAIFSPSDPKVKTSLTSRIVDALMRNLLNIVFAVQTWLLGFIPYIGTFLNLTSMCLLISTYSFEYRWVYLGWESHVRLRFVERHWAYFIGFGIPSTILCSLFPRFIDNGVFSMLFPICIMTAVAARPKGMATLGKLPIFAAVECITGVLIKMMDEKKLKRFRPQSKLKSKRVSNA